MLHGFRVYAGDKEEENTGCDDRADVLMRMRIIFCSKNPDTSANHKGSPLCLGFASAEGGRDWKKTPRQKSAAVARKGRGELSLLCVYTSNLRVLGGCRSPPVPPGSQPAQKPQRGLSPASLMNFEGMQIYFCPFGLRFAPGSRSCQLAGRRKMQWLNICREWKKKAIQNDIQAPGLALSCQENRACKMLSVPPAQQREKRRGGTFPPAAIWVHGVAAVGPFPSVGFSSRHTTETVPGSFWLSPGAGLMRVCSRGADLCSRVKHGTSECHSTSASPRFSGCCTLLSGATPSKTGQEMLPETKGKALGSDCPSSACCLLPQTWGNFLIK